MRRMHVLPAHTLITAPPVGPAADRAWRQLLAGWAVLLVLTLLWDFSGLDVAVMRQIGTPAGFALQHHPVLEHLLHDRLRQVSSVVLVLAWIWALVPARWSAASGPDRRLAVLLGTAGLVLINLIKHRSTTSCPWDWQLFGGAAEIVSHWSWGVRDGGPGRCFPGGHASTGMGFLALALPWLVPRQPNLLTPARREALQRRGWRWLLAALAVGVLCGVVQSLRGAHPPSHTLWTLVICGGVALAGWRLWPLKAGAGVASPAQAQAQRQVHQHADHDGAQNAFAPEEPGGPCRR